MALPSTHKSQLRSKYHHIPKQRSLSDQRLVICLRVKTSCAREYSEQQCPSSFESGCTKHQKTGVPKGIRTPVAAVKGRCPRPTRRWGHVWWSRTGSNRRPLQCHCSALPTELRPRERVVFSGFACLGSSTLLFSLLNKG